MKKSKYGAKKVVIDGVKFDSMREGKRYRELKLLERAGEITDLVLQPRFPFVINGIPIKMGNGHTARYTADFQYTEKGESVIEEVKGFVVRDYPLRKAIFEHLYNMKITEV